MTGKEFSQKPFTFPRGTKVKVRYQKPGSKEQFNEVCFFYGITPICGQSPSIPDDFAPVFRAVAKNGKMSNTRASFGGMYGMVFRLISDIDFFDTDEMIRVWVERWGRKGVLVCNNCGSTDIQVQGWVDANTDEFASGFGDGDSDDNWCGECEQHDRFTSLEDFERRMDDWFSQADFKTMETMFGLRHEDFDEEDGYQAFVDTCETRWKGLTYESKRELYNEYHENC